jgi:DNA-binding CsgD family transcriptional regulator
MTMRIEGTEGPVAGYDALQKPPQISPAEKRILMLVEEGKTVKEIAEALNLSTETVHKRLIQLHRMVSAQGRKAGSPSAA